VGPKIYALNPAATGIAIMTFLRRVKVKYVTYVDTFSFSPVTINSCILL
jgi:hypothetical protein